MSPANRSWETHDEIIKSFSENQLRSYEDPRLREQDFGNFQDSTSIEQQKAERTKYGQFFFRFLNGESGADVYDRISIFLESLHRSFNRPNFLQNVIIISHGLTIRLFLMRWFHWRVEFFERLENPDNCSYFVLLLQPNGKYKLETPLFTETGEFLKDEQKMQDDD